MNAKVRDFPLNMERDLSEDYERDEKSLEYHNIALYNRKKFKSLPLFTGFFDLEIVEYLKKNNGLNRVFG